MTRGTGRLFNLYRSEVGVQYESIQKKNADFKRFFFLPNAIYCTVFQFKLYLFLYLFFLRPGWKHFYLNTFQNALKINVFSRFQKRTISSNLNNFHLNGVNFTLKIHELS